MQCICFDRRKSRLSSKVNLAFPKESMVSERDSCSEERAELNHLRSLTQLEQREQILIEELRPRTAEKKKILTSGPGIVTFPTTNSTKKPVVKTGSVCLQLPPTARDYLG
jgi:hypothetical protein